MTTTPTTVKGPDAKDYPILHSTKTPGGVLVDEIRIGDGKEAGPKSTVVIHYEGTLTSGTVFDSSFKRREPATFPLNRLIKGWQEGVPGMKAGGVRRLTVPPQLGYGAGGTPDGSIPPNATLVFWMELVGVK